MYNAVKLLITDPGNKTALAICTSLVLLWPTVGADPANAQMDMKKGMQMEMAKEGVFQGKGKIIAVVPAKGQVVLDHEEIEGFMGAMTMGYSVASQELMQGLKPGDSVKFRIDAAKKQIVAMEQQGN